MFRKTVLHKLTIITLIVFGSSCGPVLGGKGGGSSSSGSGSSSSSSGGGGGGGGTSGFAVSSSGLKGLQGAGAVDLNNDAFLDLATVDTSANQIVVKASDGAGGWNAGTSLTPTGTAVGLAFGDLNKDGRPDLFATLASGGVDVFIRGAANYGAATHYNGGTSTAGLVAADLNRDAVIDVVVADFSGNQLLVYLGNAAGTLGAATTYAVGAAPAGVTAADFNHDGKLDIAATNSTDNNVSVRLGDGSGALGAQTTFSVGTKPLGITHADFNRDGHEDLAVANYTSGTVSILLGNGAGSFGAASSVTVGANPTGLVAADLNVDGKLDLVVANYGSNNASKLLGVGDGTFAAAVNAATSTGPLSVVSGDFNRSGEPDVAVLEYADTTPSLILGTDPGAPATFSDSGDVSMGAGADPLKMAVGDFDNDGDMDLAVSDFALDRIRVFFNNGTGTLTFQQDISPGAGSQITSVAAADFDRDGDLDLVAAERGYAQVEVFKNNGSGSFGAATDTMAYNGGAGGEPWDVAVADLDLDGDLDVVAAGNTYAGDPVIDVYSNDGTGDLSLLDSITSTANHQNARNIALGDLDNDGDVDIAFSVTDHNFLAFALNDGSGGFPVNPTYVSTGANSTPLGLRLADVNRDGYLDAIMAGGGSSKEGIIMTNTGTASFNAAVTYDSPLGTMTANDIVLLDFDFDGDLDYFLIAQDGVSLGSTGVQTLTGDGSTGMTHSSYVAGTCDYGQAGVVADFNRDGRPDVIAACQGDDNIAVFLAN